MFAKCIVFGIMLYGTAAYAQDERGCLSVAKIAEASAELLAAGVSEEHVIGILTDPKGADPKRPKIRQKVIDDNQVDVAKFVYTMRLSPPDARAAVYMKCMSGGLGYIDWSKHKEAARAR